MSAVSATMTVRRRIPAVANRSVERARRPAFYLVTIAFLAFLLFALRESMVMLVTGWLSDYAFPGHRTHHVMIGGMLTVFGLSIAIQLYRPIKRVGAMQVALAFVLSALVLTTIASGVGPASELLVFAVPVAIMAILHPAVRDLIPSRDSVEPRLLAIGIIGSIVAVAIAITEYSAHATFADEHVMFGHYEFMAIALISIALFAFLGALRPVGWRALVYAAAALAALYALVSVAFPGPEQGSSLGALAAIAVMLWSLAYVWTAESVEMGSWRLWQRLGIGSV